MYENDYPRGFPVEDFQYKLFKDYVAELAAPSTYGTFVELGALQDMLQRPIEVFLTNGTTYPTASVSIHL
jgi:hypothetical protein